MEKKKCFCTSLFDLSFTELITVKVIKIIYMVGIAAAGIVAITLIVRAFSKGFGVGLLHCIAAPVVFVLIVVILRILLELILTLFRIEENTTLHHVEIPIPERYRNFDDAARTSAEAAGA